MRVIQQIPEPAGLTFAHLTDPHLTTPQAAHWWQLLNKRLLGYLSWRQKRRAEHRGEVLEALLEDLQQTQPQHIVVTGDLTQVGLPDEFRQARQWLARLGKHDRVTLVPGNHDAYVRTAWEQTCAQWEPYMQSDGPFRWPSGAGAGMFPTLRVRNGVALIGLCTALPTPPFMATGRLGRQQCERLAQLLHQTGQQGLFRLVLLHHPPRVEDEKWRKRLTDGRLLCSILGREGAELVLHGHGHYTAESAIPFAGGSIPVFGIPSASAIGHKPGRRAQYYLYQVRRCAENWSVRVRVRGYQADSGRFAQQQERYLSLPVMPSTSC
jgi:3',5'-cyclic AMP phosphodiesterase CpdA